MPSTCRRCFSIVDEERDYVRCSCLPYTYLTIYLSFSFLSPLGINIYTKDFHTYSVLEKRVPSTFFPLACLLALYAFLSSSGVSSTSVFLCFFHARSRES